MKKESNRIVYSPSDLIRYLASPFASWLDRHHLENRDAIAPDEQTNEEKILSQAGDEHERRVLNRYKESGSHLVEIAKDEGQFASAYTPTVTATSDRTPVIYQAALQD